ncbi:peptide-methionine (R)-S-oxide reductase MsrB [Parahalioglobus pacificus]|uniref:Peptide methionine sulfoxide reductase MsrB n=1 Tax=Parahalioglobus pacificus TaxID=930806 RepID=A0A918XFB2_9GAMM|nr:peptide-methionine (R)-S-oxide reductase MsrB [Halioglobus pacificus]NQY01668.1 peptide-methionine (R)-S-oxide reductase MsrB [Halieaceae bacterium]GHD29208.1 peptide methionine sulfoxide reductase MsrB [Halioglobus pacificus]
MKDNEYWRDKLTPDEYYVCREKGTERAFTGEYWDCEKDGVYHCRCCGEPLFLSDTKFDAGCGWPSFFQPTQDGAIQEERDTSHGMIRTEVMCKKCGAHLGHVFPDGPAPTGLRYCINSLSIKLDESEGTE